MALYLYMHTYTSRFDSSLQEEALGKQEVCQVHSSCLYLPHVNLTWGGTVGVSHGRPAGFTDCWAHSPEHLKCTLSRNKCHLKALCLYSIPDDLVQCGSDVVTSCTKLFHLQHTFAALFPQVTTFP